ncbi:MAG: hypothetical protein Q7S45_04030 [Candidatus Curtissbacteria bacterium]|nr:hypothetical protein [Candidatus Curtissbacteria bacterium]
MTRKNWWIFPSIFILSLIIFSQSLTYYFFQDDWFVLNWIRTGNLFSFFSFRTDIIYWRPLSMPIFFFIGKQLFGLNPLGFHILAFLIHFINIILVYLLIRQLKFEKTLSYFAAFIWGTAAFHFVPLSWLSTTSYIIGPTFILSSIIFFLKSKIKTSFLFFLLGLLTSELTLVTIPLIVLVDENIRKKFKNLLPFLIAVVPYLVVRFFIFPVPASGAYAIAPRKKIISNLLWYFAWTFNVAERFSTIFYLSTVKSAAGYFKDFFKLLIGPLILMLTFWLLTLSLKPNLKILARGFGWFIIGLSPVIFLPDHAYAMYLPIASLGIIYIFCAALEKAKRFRPPIMAVVALLWFISSFLTVDLLRSNHWIGNEQAASRAYMDFLKKEIRTPPHGSIFIFRNPVGNISATNGFTLHDSESTLYQSLNASAAVQVLYDDSTLTSFFPKANQKVEFNQNQPVFEIVPK